MALGKTKTLVLHTGDHKTGSTSIQYALAARRIRLAGRTLCYPSRLAHNHLAVRFRNPQSPDAAAQFNPLAETIGKKAADVSVISAEHLEGAKPENVKTVWNTYFTKVAEQLRIVSYVRPHASRTVSTCAEVIKVGAFMGDSLEEFFDKRNMTKRLTYTPRCQSWRKEFGEAYRLRPFVRSELHEGSVVADFLKSALGDTDFTIETGKSANESLSLKDLMVIKLVHQSFQDQSAHVRLGMGWALARHLNAHESSKGEKLALHRSLAEKIASVFRNDAKAMDAEFFGGRPLLQDALDRSVETSIAEPQSLRIEDHLSPAQQRDVAAMALTMREMFDNGSGWQGYLRENKIKAISSL